MCVWGGGGGGGVLGAISLDINQIILLVCYRTQEENITEDGGTTTRQRKVEN